MTRGDKKKEVDDTASQYLKLLEDKKLVEVQYKGKQTILYFEDGSKKIGIDANTFFSLFMKK